MHAIFDEIPYRILENAKCAIAQANMHAIFLDPGNEHWGNVSVLNAAQAGELVMKAAIANVHPLLIFQNVFDLDDANSEDLDIERIIQRAKTHEFHNLPKVMWAVLKDRLPDLNSFNEMRKMRNAVQHFYHPGGFANYGEAARRLSLDFLYKNVDPILKKYFDLSAIEFHEDSEGYFYIVQALLRHEIIFSIPDDFDMSREEIEDAVIDASEKYRTWVEHAILSKLD
ncbi:hypothetical protein SAMN05880590_102540 [Rhizobium sp. RU35A]|uniref:hypothetical protein n=1 Tax=Rhizobium sp. RU35A TaxID=1907414 RepID=UPI000954645C|nr:hypothetical protein [Rhizobium sp. RU35A]SIQ20002.1 hypothetical protein SAMN05880590_102540 [Rhizobium sp. RU35A]